MKNRLISNEFKLWSAFLIVLGGLIYAFLVAGDYLLQKKGSSKAELIESIRIEKEDWPQRRAALAQGFKPLLSPYSIGKYRQFKDLSVKLGVAPLAPQPHSRLFFCNEGFGLVTYTTDRFGFRNDDRLWDDKQIDVVLIGDSYTHGACVVEKDSIPQAFPSSLKILNLATWGNQPIHYAAIAKTFIPKIKPKLAVMVFYANDMYEDEDDSIYYEYYFSNEATYFDSMNGNRLVLSRALQEFYADSEPLVQDVFASQATSSSGQAGFLQRDNIVARAAKYFTLPNIRAHLENGVAVLSNRLPFSSKLAIDTLIQVCERHGCQALVAYIPNSDFWSPNPRARQYAGLLSEYSKKKAIPFVDTTDSVRSFGEAAYALKGPHLSRKGNKIVANELVTAMVASITLSSQYRILVKEDRTDSLKPGRGR